MSPLAFGCEPSTAGKWNNRHHPRSAQGGEGAQSVSIHLLPPLEHLLDTTGVHNPLKCRGESDDGLMTIRRNAGIGFRLGTILVSVYCYVDPRWPRDSSTGSKRERRVWTPDLTS